MLAVDTLTKILEEVRRIRRHLEDDLTMTSAAYTTDSHEKAIDKYLATTKADDIGKAQLLLLLNANEWNIARVSRLMNVTRRTVYLRLARFGIDRVKVRKTRGHAA